MLAKAGFVITNQLLYQLSYAGIYLGKTSFLANFYPPLYPQFVSPAVKKDAEREIGIPPPRWISTVRVPTRQASFDELFESRHYLKPVADFRDEVAAALPRRTATQLIELCQVECSPRVSFETAETKTKER